MGSGEEQSLYRAKLALLNTMTARQTAALWPLLDPRDVVGTYGRWKSQQTALIMRSRAVAEALSADWLRQERDLAGVPGTFTPVFGELAEEQLSTSLDVVALHRMLAAVQTGRSVQDAVTTGLVSVTGSTTRYVMNAARETVMETAVEDEECVGWYRVASPTGCDFCRTLAASRRIYRTYESGHFAAHDHCSCIAVATWGETGAVYAYTPSPRKSERNNAAIREWIGSMRADGYI